MQASMKPPGVCQNRNSHGPLEPVDRKPYGRHRLAKLLGLSADASIDQVCEDAAQLIEEMRSGVQDVVVEDRETIRKSRKRQMQES